MNGGNYAHIKSVLARSAIYIALALAMLAIQGAQSISRWYYLNQDLQAGLLLIAAFAIAWRWCPRASLPSRPPSVKLVLAASAALAALLWLGTYLVMFDYPLTRDEHMVAFDGAVYAAGKLAERLPSEWAGYAVPLVPAFLLDAPGNSLLVSAYMPVNAMARSAFGSVLDPALMNPLLAAVGLVALHRIAIRLFPDSPGAVWVTLGGYVLSAQVLVNAMTNYAMTGHLALNLVWLALFLRGTHLSHAGAMAIAFPAIGLHQIIFHPLFAAPFILMLAVQKRWKPFAAYCAVYAAALLFWMIWQTFVAASADVAPEGSTSGLSGFITERVVSLLVERDPQTVPLMIYNLLRAVAWNAAFVLPFLLLALPAVRKSEGLAVPLALGVAGTVLAMMVLLPYQGHGWGYRYIHAVLGNILLLAGYGYRRLSSADRRTADGLAGMLAAVTLLLVLPFLLWTSRAFVEPYVRLTELINRQKTDFVIVDTEPVPSAIDQVRNLPDLSNRPLIFSSRSLYPEQIIELCERGSITLIPRRDFRSVGFAPYLPLRSPGFEKRTGYILGSDCLRPLVR